jgi:hypothetical protein
MPGWLRILVVAAAVLALLPSAAAAQSAGDEQYSDPFANDQKPSPAPAAKPAPAAQPAQVAATPAPAASAPAATAAPAEAAQLPRSGWAAWVPAVLGLLLVSAGVALRAHVRRDA